MPFNISLPAQIAGLISTIRPADVLEILLVAIILYKLYAMLEGTRAITLVKGILVLFMANFFCNVLQLNLLSWIFEKIMTWMFVLLPIVFQPELRRTLERLGQGKFLFTERETLDVEEANKVIEELVRASKSLSSTKTGALMVIEREMGLNDVADTGIKLDAKITAELIGNVFFVNTPLHDGAAIIRGNRLYAAGCLLPLTEKRGLSKELGTRHRAAIGISEQCDALVLVVSEETGTISVAENGRLMRHLNGETLASVLRPAFIHSHRKNIFDVFTRWRTHNAGTN